MNYHEQMRVLVRESIALSFKGMKVKAPIRAALERHLNREVFPPLSRFLTMVLREHYTKIARPVPTQGGGG